MRGDLILQFHSGLWYESSVGEGEEKFYIPRPPPPPSAHTHKPVYTFGVKRVKLMNFSSTPRNRSDKLNILL